MNIGLIAVSTGRPTGHGKKFRIIIGHSGLDVHSILLVGILKMP